MNEAERYKAKWKACQEFMNKVLRLLRPITPPLIWERVDYFGREYNVDLEKIDAVVTQETGYPNPFHSDTSLADLQREHSRISELIRRKVCGDPSATVTLRSTTELKSPY